MVKHLIMLYECVFRMNTWDGKNYYVFGLIISLRSIYNFKGDPFFAYKILYLISHCESDEN